MVRFGTLLTAVAALRSTSAIPTIEVKGSKFFDSNGNQFYIKGVTYQVTNFLNSLTNSAQCSIDAKLIAQLGANVIRVYSIDPTLTVTNCMKAFEDEGIYVIVDMTTPNYAFNRLDPQWTTELRNQFAKVLDGLHEYDNLLALIAGNEVVNDVNTTIAAPVVKAAIADMKAYRDAMQYRKIPIGYSNSDQNILSSMADYMDCGNTDVAADFFSFNRYSWCGDSSFTKSAYDKLYDSAEGFDIPIFLSENGCNTISPRKFSDQSVILGREMNDRFSGNIMYQWHQEENDYGLVDYSVDAATGTPSMLPDYSYLSAQWATLSPAGIKATAYDPTLTKRDCPTFSSRSWLVQASEGTTLPTLGLSGFTTPTAPVSTRSSTASSVTGSASASNVATDSPGAAQSGTPSKTPIGAIVGGVVGGLVVLGLVIGLLFLWRRKKAAKRSTPDTPDTHEAGVAKYAARSSNDSGGLMNGYPELGDSGGWHELPGRGQTQELDPARGTIAALRANELSPFTRPGELPPDARSQQSPGEDTRGRDVTLAETPSALTIATAAESLNVQAQRRREVEWLESEEARMREQRERLMRQRQ